MPGDEDNVMTGDDGAGGSPPPGGVQTNVEGGDAANADQLQGAQPGMYPGGGGGTLVDQNGNPMPQGQDVAGGDTGGADTGMASNAGGQGESAGGALPEDSPVYTDGPANHGDGGSGSPATAGGIVAPTGSIASIEATAYAALQLAAKKHGVTISPALAGMMLAQVRGESVFGATGTWAGTNNWGAAQATTGFANKYKGQKGFGAFANYDSDPNKGPFLGWYWIAPSQAAAAESWLFDNWWGPRLIAANPSTPTEYASILYSGGYFGGTHPGGNKDPSSPAGAQNVADYVHLMGAPVDVSKLPKAGDPTKVTANPKLLANLATRRVTAALFTSAQGGAWKAWLPANFAALQSTNGVIWFGPAPGGVAVGGIVAAVAAVVGALVLLVTFAGKKGG